jgi:hypothetical protein
MADRSIYPFGPGRWGRLVERYGTPLATDIWVVEGYARSFSNREARRYAIDVLERSARIKDPREHELIRQRAIAIWRLRQQLDE